MGTARPALFPTAASPPTARAATVRRAPAVEERARGTAVASAVEAIAAAAALPAAPTLAVASRAPRRRGEAPLRDQRRAGRGRRRWLVFRRRNLGEPDRQWHNLRPRRGRRQGLRKWCLRRRRRWWRRDRTDLRTRRRAVSGDLHRGRSGRRSLRRRRTAR